MIVTASGADLSRAHLVGAGGAGMSAIATILLQRGAEVSGSDARASSALTAITQRGARTAVGQRAANLDLLPGGPSAVVLSTAIRPDNPEVVEAVRRGLPLVSRAEALAALMRGHQAICVAGTHGKTSTTSMLTVALRHAGLDPSFAIGGELTEAGVGAHHGTGDIFVAEADESDGSFLAYRPRGAIITTIEPDHLDHHGTAAAYAQAFVDFAAQIRPDGFLVAGVDDPGVRELIRTLTGDGNRPRIIGYGQGPAAEVTIRSIVAEGAGQRAEIAFAGGTVVPLSVRLPGEHMVGNATAALIAGMELGVDPQEMAAGIASFAGVRRRFELRGEAGGIRIYDDYAHHPTEVSATLAGARSVAGDGRVVVVFQPHLYSRTAQFADRFAEALAAADIVIVLDIYGAREDPQPGVTSRLITDRLRASSAACRDIYDDPSPDRVPDVITGLARSGDVVLTMGAGDVTALGPEILRALREHLRQGSAG